jgi:hypothetical protein
VYATTDGDGNYCREDLPPGLYMVSVTDHTGARRTAPPARVIAGQRIRVARVPVPAPR